MVDNLSFLLAFAGCHPVVSTKMGNTPVNLAGATVYPVQYCRNPGARVLMLEASLLGAAEDYASLSVTASSGSISWIAQNGWDGTTPLGTVGFTRLDRASHRAFLDVSALTVGTTIELRVTYTPGSAQSLGIECLTVSEVPVAASDAVGSPSTEVGLDAGWPDVSRQLVEGAATSSPRGMRRYVAELDRARKVKRYIQILRGDADNTAWSTVNAAYENFFVADPVVRARWVYGAGYNNTYDLRVTYRTSNGSTDGSFRLTDSATNSTAISLPASTTRTTVNASFAMDASASNQETTLTYEKKRTAGAGTVYISNVALVENEA